MKKTIFSELLDSLFVPLCSVCGTSLPPGQRGLCLDCESDIVPIVSPLCRVCGHPFEMGRDHLCSSCLLHRPSYDIARSMVLFTGPSRYLIHRLKYNFDTTIRHSLLKIADSYDFSPFSECEIFVPVPLYSQRLRQRGLNQALFLSRIFFPQRRRDIQSDLLLRQRATRFQTDLDRKLRKANVAGAFVVPQPKRVVNKNVCIIDDVYTTGATISECASVLKRAGAQSVKVLTFARVLLG